MAGKAMTFFTDLLIRDIQIPENPTALDLGCGTGISTFELMRRIQGRGRFYEIDISQKMIDLASQELSISATVMLSSAKGMLNNWIFQIQFLT